MPAVQPRPVFIKPVATQRSQVNVQACVPPHQLVAATAAARVLKAASRNVSFTVESAADAAASAVSLRCDGSAAVLRSYEGPLEVSHIRAFHPCLRAAVSDLDIVLVSPTAVRPDASAEMPLLTARRSRDRSMVEYACRYAQRLRRKRVTVLPGPLTSSARAPAWIESLAAQFPDVILDRVPVDTALGRLASGKAPFDVLVVPAGFFGLVGAVAAGLSGAPELVTHAQVGTDGLRFSVGNAFSDDNASPASLEGLLLSAASLLVHTGQAAAAQQVTNAVLKALEDGLHSDGLKLLAPYTRRLDDDSLADAIIERLGSRPKRLQPACDEAAGNPVRQGPKLQVVSSA